MKSKVKERDELIKIVGGLKKKGKEIVFTNGCFDILHVGHIRLFREAKSLGDILIVGLNSDSSANKIKGEGRPFVTQKERAEVLSALEMIDYVTIFDETDPHQIISMILPNVLVKGSDWPEEGIVGRDVVESKGGKVVRVALVGGRSSSSLIDRILERGSPRFDP